MHYDEYRAMNTLIQVAAEGNRQDLEPGFRQVREFIAASEERFSRFRPESELCQLNRSAGRWFDASAELFDLLRKALALYRQTGGLFDPSILNVLQQAGYDRSMDDIRLSGARPAASAPALGVPGLQGVRLDPDRQGIFLPAGVQIDLGGIAKGWIADRAVSILSETTSAGAVGAGGDMAFYGKPGGEQFWEISLEDPRDAQQTLAVLTVSSGGLATSSVTRRRWLQSGQERHHIIDPRTGEPADVEWLSVSVGAADAANAEALAKAVLIAGSQAAFSLIRQFPDAWFVAVAPDGALSGTLEGMEMVYELA
jgi:FAD:protein FMN transferase